MSDELVFNNLALSLNKPLTIGIVAGEASGDALGGDFMAKMNALHPNVRWVGVGGDAMQKAGLTSLFDIKRLSVMGLVEVVKHLPDLLLATKEILDAFCRHNIDIFVGIDAPDFNLRISKSLKNQSLIKPVFCVQYVSPSIWAWRENRIFNIKAVTDLVLCLFPFELPVYQKHQHPAVCVGHPLLAKLSPDTRTDTDKFQAFLQKFSPNFPKLLHFTQNQQKICLMPGSRLSEIHAILPLLVETMVWLNDKGDFCYLLPVISQEHKDFIESFIQETAPALSAKICIIFNQKSQFDINDCSSSANASAANYQNLSVSQEIMNISSLVILASGTATLEALLLHRPMIVVYKVNRFTYLLAKRLVKIPYVCLPNILSFNQTRKPIVPELLQHDANAENIGKHALNILKHPSTQINEQKITTDLLRQNSHANPAKVVLTYFFE